MGICLSFVFRENVNFNKKKLFENIANEMVAGAMGSFEGNYMNLARC